MAQKFYLEGPGGLPGVKLAGEVRTAKPVILEGALTTTTIVATTVTATALTAASGTAVPAGGSAAASIQLGSGATGLGVYFGSGAPTVTAAKGSLYIRTDGSSTSTRLYVNTDGATTWTNITTAA